MVLPKLLGSIIIFYVCYILIGKVLDAALTTLLPEMISETAYLFMTAFVGMLSHIVGLLIVVPSVAAPTILYFELKKRS